MPKFMSRYLVCWLKTQAHRGLGHRFDQKALGQPKPGMIAIVEVPLLGRSAGQSDPLQHIIKQAPMVCIEEALLRG
jgi:hypothetical protein